MTAQPIEVPAQNFRQRKLSVQIAGLMGSRLLLDGVPLRRVAGVYTLKDDKDETVRIKLRTSFFDCVPTVMIDGEPVTIAPPLPWHEQILCWLPMALVFQGYALGAMVGWVAANINMRLLRAKLPSWARYASVVAVIVAALILFLFLRQSILSLQQSLGVFPQQLP